MNATAIGHAACVLATRIAVLVGLPTATTAVVAHEWLCGYLAEMLAICVGIDLLVAGVVALVLARLALRPLAQLHATGAELAGGDLGVSLRTGGDDSVAGLCCVLERLRRQLMTAERQQLTEAASLGHRVLTMSKLDGNASLVRRIADIARTTAVESALLLGQPLHVRILIPGESAVSPGFVATPCVERVQLPLRAGGVVVVELHPVCLAVADPATQRTQARTRALARLLCERIVSMVDSSV